MSKEKLLNEISLLENKRNIKLNEIDNAMFESIANKAKVAVDAYNETLVTLYKKQRILYGAEG